LNTAIKQIHISGEERLKGIQKYISRMPSLSTTVTKVLEICNNPDISPNDLNRVISFDPVLTGQVLRLINSVYYSLPNKTTSLTRAIIILGLNTVKNLALSTAVLQRLSLKRSFKNLPTDDFWIHSLCVGVIAKSLASIRGVPVTEREEYFIAGLLHDLGKIPLNNLFPDKYAQVLESTKLRQDSLYQVENTVFEIDHSTVGKMVAEKWSLGGTIIDSVYYHHNPDKAKEENRHFIAVVALANISANIFKIGSSGDHLPDGHMVNDILEQVGIDRTTLLGLRETVLDEIEKAKIFLRVTNKA